MIFLLFLFSGFFLHIDGSCAKQHKTHLEKVSKHLFLFKPYYVTTHEESFESDKKEEAELIDSTESDEEALGFIAQTELSKALAQKCETSSASKKDIADLTQMLLLTDSLKKTHSAFLGQISNREKERTQQGIALVNSMNICKGDPQYNKTAYLEKCKDYKTKFPVKFRQMISIVRDCGLRAAHDALSKHIKELDQTSSDAFQVLNSVLKEKKLQTIGDLIRFAQQTSANI